MASGKSTQETSNAIIESVIDTSASAGALVHPKDKSIIKDGETTVSVSHADITTIAAGGPVKHDNSDVVSQTRSGSAPISVISSAQSMDPSKKDSGKH